MVAFFSKEILFLLKLYIKVFTDEMAYPGFASK